MVDFILDSQGQKIWENLSTYIQLNIDSCNNEMFLCGGHLREAVNNMFTRQTSTAYLCGNRLAEAGLHDRRIQM